MKFKLIFGMLKIWMSTSVATAVLQITRYSILLKTRYRRVKV